MWTRHTESECLAWYDSVKGVWNFLLCRGYGYISCASWQAWKFLEPHPLTDGILDTVVFQQDGAPRHYAIIVRDYIDRSFPGRWIGRGGTQPWAEPSPGLTPLDFFACGFIKSKVYTGRRIGDLAELRNRIIDAVQKITPHKL